MHALARAVEPVPLRTREAADFRFGQATEKQWLTLVSQGIFHFLTHPDLWNPLRSKLAAYLVLYSGVLASVFFLTYIPQLTVMALVNGPFAVFSAALLVLNESSTITSFISKKYLLQDALLDTFDSTLVARDAAKVVAQGRELETRGQSTQSLGKLLKRPSSSFSTAELIRYAMYLPLNLVPGTTIRVYKPAHR